MDCVPDLCQIGPLRSVPQTQNEIRRQLEKATEGSLTAVTTMQTAMGTKDRVSQIWIEKIIAKTKELKISNPQWMVAQVKEAVLEWLNRQTSDPWSPLLYFAGEAACQPPNLC